VKPSGNRPPVIDLHGTRHAEVKRKVELFIEDNWGIEEDVTIITGHSTKMKGIVLNTLDEYNLTYMVSHMNEGKLITWLY